MLNPTLSDLIGGIQSVTLGDEEARRRRTQKSVLERKAPPTFDVIVEISRPRAGRPSTPTSPTPSTRCCAATRSPRSCAGATRKASIARQGRPRPSPREQLGAERFAGLVGAGSPWRMEPGWRGDGAYRSGGYREAERGSGVRPGLSARRDRWLALVAWRVRPGAGDPRSRLGGWLGRHAAG